MERGEQWKEENNGKERTEWKGKEMESDLKENSRKRETSSG